MKKERAKERELQKHNKEAVKAKKKQAEMAYSSWKLKKDVELQTEQQLALQSPIPDLLRGIDLELNYSLSISHNYGAFIVQGFKQL